MLNNNLFVSTFTLEMYGPHEYLPWIYLFELKVFTYTKAIT